MILVVDDHVDTRYVVVRLLARLGYEAAAVGGGVEAVAFLSGAKPELVILDLNMPCMDGLEVLRVIRGEPRLADLPVVMFSGDPSDARRAEVEALCFRGWIVKASMDWDRIEHFAKLYGVRKES
jgi:chemosensory pili system protein ChpA (sensor histidine kinase/response regulator)